jgi:hypothetical protein
MSATIQMPPELVWDYPAPPEDLHWRLQRVGSWFPGFGRDRHTVRQLFLHLRELDIPPETKALIELYEEAWQAREREEACGGDR